MTERERLTTERAKTFARESITLNSMNKEELRRHYNEIFDRLQEYEVKEENGLLLIPPCKVGDTVWALTENNIPLECDITQILIDKLGTRLVYEPKAFRGKLYGVKSEAFGKTIFFTEREAEAALKGGEE